MDADEKPREAQPQASTPSLRRRRRPRSTLEQAKRVAWGTKWGAINSRAAEELKKAGGG